MKKNYKQSIINNIYCVHLISRNCWSNNFYNCNLVAPSLHFNQFSAFFTFLLSATFL